MRGIQTTHNQYITIYHQVYYSHMLASIKNPCILFRIVHDNVDKSKTSISRIGKKEKVISNVMNLSISLTGMLTHGHKKRVFGHFILFFLEMGSNITMDSLVKCLKDIEEPMVNHYGNLICKSGTSNHPLHDAILRSGSYEKCVVYEKYCIQVQDIHNEICCRFN